jgi:hypothetical protein
MGLAQMIELKEAVHAIIAPSILDRIVGCNGSVALCAQIPAEPETDDEAEGHAAHWVALTMAMQMGQPVPLGSKAPNGVEVDQEMIDGGRIYTEALEGFPGTGEQTIRIARIHAEHCYGTPDFYQYSDVRRTLRIVEYKYGHKYVEVFRNWQMMSYASGVMDLLKLDDQQTILDFVLVQPRWYHRDGPIRRWTVEATAIRPYINDAATAAEAALSSHAVCKTGNHCEFCPARHRCGTLHAAVGNIVDFVGQRDLMSQSPDDVGRELRILHIAAKRLNARITGKETQALELMKQGKRVPFYKTDSTNPHVKWIKSVAEIEALGMIYGKKLIKDPEPITPRQAIMLGIDAAVIDGYSQRPHGSTKLVPDSTENASKVFAQ